MLPADLERQVEAAVLIRDLQKRVRRLETLENAEGAAGCLTLLEDIKLGASAVSITFSSISQAHRHLWLWINARVVDDAGNADHMRMTYNGDTGANYRYFRIRHVGTAHAAGGGTGSINYIELEVPGGPVSGSDPIFGGHEINIYDYTSIAKEKPCTWKSWMYSPAEGGGEGPGSSTNLGLGGGHWKTESSAISSITITKGPAGGDFGIGSQFTLYGLC